MINTGEFFEYLTERKIEFFTGVPDSLLKDLCACIISSSKVRNITAANEGNAVAAACGYYLSTGKPAVVYMQNSGIGNAVNPLVSLADKEVYSIPMLMIVGWRGEPGIKDEPQHIKQGSITHELFETMGIPAYDLTEDYKTVLEKCFYHIHNEKRTAAIIVRKNTFTSFPYPDHETNYSLSRERSIEIITQQLDDKDIVVSTTGKTSRELYEIRQRTGKSHSCDFLTVGSMGHTSSIALGISLGTDRKVYCIDGDGSFLMHMGSAAVNAKEMGDNFRYIVINNGAHESVGGQPTAGFNADIPAILSGCGFSMVIKSETEDELETAVKLLKDTPYSALVIYSKQGSRPDLGRPKTSPVDNKEALMKELKK